MTGTMQAIRLAGSGFTCVDDVPIPVPASDESLLRIRMAGICGTDLAMQAGYAAFNGIAGHEFVAERVVDGIRSGDRVVADINLGCGHCEHCLERDGHHCERRRVVGIRDHQGAFANYLCLPSANLVPVPDALPDSVAVLAEPVAAALEVTAQVGDVKGCEALVVGAGRLGILIGRVLAIAGAEVTQVVRSQDRDRFVGGGIAITRTLPESRFPLVVECTGSPAGLAGALECTAPQGRLVLKSTYASQPALDVSRVVVDEISLIGSRCGSMPAALGWLLENDVSALEVKTYPLAACSEAFAAATRPSAFKVAFRP